MQTTAVKSIREENAPINENVFHMHSPYFGRTLLEGEKIISKSNEPVVVYFPSGNYNEPCELGRYKNEHIARTILSALNLSEFRVFSLETGEELFVQ